MEIDEHNKVAKTKFMATSFLCLVAISCGTGNHNHMEIGNHKTLAISHYTGDVSFIVARRFYSDKQEQNLSLINS